MMNTLPKFLAFAILSVFIFISRLTVDFAGTRIRLLARRLPGDLCIQHGARIPNLGG